VVELIQGQSWDGRGHVALNLVVKELVKARHVLKKKPLGLSGVRLEIRGAQSPRMTRKLRGES